MIPIQVALESIKSFTRLALRLGFQRKMWLKDNVKSISLGGKDDSRCYCKTYWKRTGLLALLLAKAQSLNEIH